LDLQLSKGRLDGEATRNHHHPVKMALEKRINIDEPRWDQSTYWGRAKHFFVTTNPLNLLCSGKELDDAKDIVTRYR